MWRDHDGKATRDHRVTATTECQMVLSGGATTECQMVLSGGATTCESLGLQSEEPTPNSNSRGATTGEFRTSLLANACRRSAA